MVKRVFDLYLDESGTFQREGEHTLIGGVMIPNEQNPNFSAFMRWEEEIRKCCIAEGLWKAAELAAGDEWHELYVKSKRKCGLNAQEKTCFRELSGEKRYVFAHCSENESKPIRWKTQNFVLREYMKKLAAVGGVPVIFDNPDGIYHIDSNTTFMSIFAGGVVKLYHFLMKEYPNEEVVLKVHAASRINATKKYEEDRYNVSPIAGVENNLERSLYINQIGNYVFLNGGFDLLELDGFKESVECFDILQDFTLSGKEVPNPATVICDYVCNCTWADTPSRKYMEILKDSGLLYFMAFGENPDLSESKLALLEQNHDWLYFLKTLISRSFPQKETDEFFIRMAADRYDQQQCINGLVSYLYPFVENRENMPEWINRLDLIIDHCKPFRKDAYLILTANLLIYKYSLQTHLGQDVTATQTAFGNCIHQIRFIEQRDLLLLLFCNRQIVTETDCFRYDLGHEWFEAIRQYSENLLKNSSELMTWFSLLSDGKETDVRSEQYGKALGSYIQLLTKEYRVSSEARKPELKEEAEKAIQLAFIQLSDSNSRALQNACDFFVELGEYDRALKNLLLSITRETNIGDHFEENAAAVLELCGNLGEKNLFAFLHYVNLMHRCFRNGDPRGEVMLRLIRATPVSLNNMNHLIGEPYPKAVILRHLAASLAYAEGQGGIAQTLFDTAIQALTNRGELFMTISMSVRAEMIALGLEQRLRGSREEWQVKAEHFLRKTLPAYAETAKHNPFPDTTNDTPTTELAEYLHQLADMVVY